MHFRCLCLGGAPDDSPHPVDGASAPRIADALAQWALTGGNHRVDVHLHQVIRHIPTDSLSDQRAHLGVVPQADSIQWLVQVYFDHAVDARQTARAAQWQAILAPLGDNGSLLFALGGWSNPAITPRAAAGFAGIRRLILLSRNAAHDADSFRDAWFGRHAQLIRHLPELNGYLQDQVTERWLSSGGATDYETLPFDGIAQMYYEDDTAMARSYQSAARDPVREDGRTLLGRINTLLVRSTVNHRPESTNQSQP